MHSTLAPSTHSRCPELAGKEPGRQGRRSTRTPKACRFCPFYHYVRKRDTCFCSANVSLLLVTLNIIFVDATNNGQSVLSCSRTTEFLTRTHYRLLLEAVYAYGYPV